ncbi:MAG: hypothetical protein HY927_08575 [Elusimicrobia bacterium]|nr:hypothetical protein [Elusimicrobiota bacterium]
MGREFGIRTLFVWQPNPEYGYDLRFHLFSSQLDPLSPRREGYGYAAENRRSLESVPGFLWLADMQAGLEKPLYVDDVHYTAEMNRLIAGRIAEDIRRRGWLRR